MTLLIKNGGYAFLIRLDLMFSMPLWKEFQLLQISNDLSVRHLIKLILYENDLKLLKFKWSPHRLICDMLEVWDLIIDTWNEYIKKGDGMANLSPFCYSFCSPCSFLSLFVFFCFLHFSLIYCFHYLYANYWHLLLS